MHGKGEFFNINTLTAEKFSETELFMHLSNQVFWS